MNKKRCSCIAELKVLWAKAYDYIPSVWASIHCESRMEKHDLQARKSWWQNSSQKTEHLTSKYKNKSALVLINSRKHECKCCQLKDKKKMHRKVFKRIKESWWGTSYKSLWIKSNSLKGIIARIYFLLKVQIT